MGHKTPTTPFDFDDIRILPNWQSKGIVYSNVDLGVEIGGVQLRFPFITAAMRSVVGREMAFECARNGIMSVIPCSYSIKEQTEIIRDVKSQEVKEGDVEFNKDPVRVTISTGNETMDICFEKYKEFGHSTIPIVDDFRHLKAMFRYQNGVEDYISPEENITKLIRKAKRDKRLRNVLTPFDEERAKPGKDFYWEAQLDDTETIKAGMQQRERRGVPILKDDRSLAGLAFIYDYPGYIVGAAIHTHRGWERRAEALLDAGADIIFIDASDALTDFQYDVVANFKRRYPDKPICAGNFITTGYVIDPETGEVKQADYIDRFVDAGVDAIKIGMGTGSACVTTTQRGVGRTLPTALREIKMYMKAKGYNTPLIADGGIPEFETEGYYKREDKTIEKLRIKNMGRIPKAFIWADAVMMGGWFNSLKEAAGEEIFDNGVLYKLGWGEGSQKAQSFRRYDVGEDVRRAGIEEGEERLYRCIGRLKPNLEREATRLAMTLCNVGAKNIREYHERVFYDLSV